MKFLKKLPLKLQSDSLLSQFPSRFELCALPRSLRSIGGAEFVSTRSPANGRRGRNIQSRKTYSKARVDRDSSRLLRVPA
jgi:hypothetical protein